MKKIIALVLALTMILSIATTSAFACFKTTSASVPQKSTGLISKLFSSNPIGSIFSKDETKETIAVPTFADILANVKKGLEGTGLVYGRDYKVKVEDDSTFGYRIHLIRHQMSTQAN